MKNNLKLMLRHRLRSIGMVANDANMNRLLNHVVEKAKIHDILAKMSEDAIFQATRATEKEEGDYAGK